jgi:glycosyltransferase involved in cell wall biosynthesis
MDVAHYPLVTVVIPVYNCARYLGEALGSVFNQTYDRMQVIVVDDGSTDGSSEVAARFGSAVQLCRQPRLGPGTARNHGVERASGEFIAFLDADDLWPREKLAHQLAPFECQPELDIVFGLAEQFISPEMESSVAGVLQCPSGTMPAVSPGGMLVRSQSFFRVGYFETDHQIGDFLDWYLRATDLGLLARVLPEVVLRRRIHSDNLGVRERDARMGYVRVLKAALDRRRATRTETGTEGKTRRTDEGA